MKRIKFNAWSFKDNVMYNVCGTYESVACLEWHGPGAVIGTLEEKGLDNAIAGWPSID